MYFSDLVTLADQGSLYAYLRQVELLRRLDQELGEHTWEVDVERREIVFRSARGRRQLVRLHAHLVATLTGDRLHWGWAQGNLEDPLAEALREYGTSHRVGSLRAPSPTIGDSVTSFERGLAAHRVGSTAVAITGLGPYYCVQRPEGGIAVLLVQGNPPGVRLEPSAATALGSVLASSSIFDQRAALHGLARLAGWEIQWQPDWRYATLLDSATGVGFEATFDSEARLVRSGILQAA